MRKEQDYNSHLGRRTDADGQARMPVAAVEEKLSGRVAMRELLQQLVRVVSVRVREAEAVAIHARPHRGGVSRHREG